MKRILLIIIGCILMISCAEKNPDGTIHAPEADCTTLKFYTIVIDSCQYISSDYRLAHKGNCKFCEERRRNELIKIINNQQK